MKPHEKKIEVVVVGTRCVYINDRRVAGNKPYVSENLPQHSFTCSIGNILDGLPREAVRSWLSSKQPATSCLRCGGWGVDDVTGFACPSCRPIIMQPTKKVKASPLGTFLREAARYFEERPTNGEDKAHWSNVYNGDSCRRAADFIDRFWEEAYARETD